MSRFQNTEINNGNNSSSSKDQQQQQKASQFSEIPTKLIDKLLDKHVSVTYTFDHLEIIFHQHMVQEGRNYEVQNGLFMVK